MKRSQKIIKAVVFCVLTVLMVFHLTRLLTPKWLDSWDASKTEKTYYKLEKDSIDVLFMGSSGMAASIDPYQLYDEQGISSYNLNCNQQTLLGTYFWMKEALKTQDPDVIVVEVSAIAMKQEVAERVARRSYDFMNWSVNKLSFVFTFRNTGEMGQPLISYLFPLYEYHTRWSELRKDDYEFIYGDTDVFARGYVPKTDVFGRHREVTYAGITLDPTEKMPVIETNRKALADMIELCREEGIQIVLYKSCDAGWSAASHNNISEIAKQYDVPFLDMNEPDIMEAADINYRTDALDRRHMNIRGAEKSTSYVGQYLKDNFDLPDRRTDERIAAIFDAGRGKYECAMENARLAFCTDPVKYIELADKDRYVYFAAGPGFQGTFTSEQAELLLKLGMSEEFTEEFSAGKYTAAVFGNGTEAFFERDSSSTVKVRGMLPSGEVYTVTAGDGETSIIIDEIEFVQDKDNVTVVVYDMVLHEAADCFCIGANKDKHIVINR